MKEKLLKPVILSQLEEALEERQRIDRRKIENAVPPQDVPKERRTSDRRTKKKTKEGA
jgi:hypothetical protein